MRSYQDGQEPVVTLVSTVQAVREAGIPSAFTDGHATLAVSNFFDDPADLAQIDWSVMPLTYWNDTATYPDRKRRRQAEFLVHRSLPWELVTMIGVMNTAARARVELALGEASIRPTVSVQRAWYY